MKGANTHEYQDISRQRFDLVTALHEVTSAKIIAVGDDWQSIYAFSGSDISLFTKFREKMGYAALLKIVRTYRNSQEVIDIAGNFIQKNSEQIQKDLISPSVIILFPSAKVDRAPLTILWRYARVAILEFIVSSEIDKKEVMQIKRITSFGSDFQLSLCTTNLIEHPSSLSESP